MVPRSRGLLFFVVGLLAINLILSFATRGPNEPRQVPYQPFFVNQVKAENVKEMTSRGESIEGELKKKTAYNSPDGKSVDVTSFKTVVPSFIDPADLTKQLTASKVVVN